MEIKGNVSKCANCSVTLQDGQYSGVEGNSSINNNAAAAASGGESSSSERNNGKRGVGNNERVGSLTVSVSDKEIEVPLSVALAEVFKLRPLFDGKTWEEVSANQLILCQACSLVFSKLYSLLLDFNCLRSADSFLAESIRCLEALIGRITASQSGAKSEIIFHPQGQSGSTNHIGKIEAFQQQQQQESDGGIKVDGGDAPQQMQVQLVATNNAQGQPGATGNGPGYILINVCSSTPAAAVTETDDQTAKRHHQKGATGGKGDGPVKCEKCGEECLSARALGLHRFRHHNTDNPFVCEICKKGFASIINLKLHSQRHSDSRPFECEYCGSTFKMKFDLKQHHHTVHSKDGLQLNLPNERGGKRGRMRLDQEHHPQIRQSTDAPPVSQGGGHHQNFSRPVPPTGISLVFKCTDCGEDFHSAMTLGVHRSSVHQAPDPYKCHMCWQSFPYSNDLRVHLTEHVNGRSNNSNQGGDGRMYANDGYQGNDQMMGYSTKSTGSSGGNSQQPLNLVSMYGTSPSSSTYDPASLLEVNLEEPEMKVDTSAATTNTTVTGGRKD